jgi:hypothetical protein
MSHHHAAPAPLRSLGSSLVFSAMLVVPFAVLQWANRRTLHEEFPFVLFAFMSVHALLVVLALAPGVRRLRAERRLAALRAQHWAGLLVGVFLAAVYAGVIRDQLPCFLGVPHCD